MKYWIALLNMLGLYNGAQSQAALKQLIEASGGDMHEMARKAHEAVVEKQATAQQNKSDAKSQANNAWTLYQASKKAADLLDSNADKLAEEAALVENAARLMGIQLVPKADNKQLKKV